MDTKFKDMKAAETPKSKCRQKQMWRPVSHVPLDKGGHCPYCGEAVKVSYAICPHCGHSLTPDKCSFCGAPMKPGAKFCTRCGQSKEGIVCPECGTLNSRNFCRKCNTPLTPAGQIALAAAKEDPAFRAVEQKARELAELHAKIESLQNESAQTQAGPSLSDGDKALLEEYADLLDSIGSYIPNPQKISESTSEASSRPHYEEKFISLDEMMAAYREKAEEMNAAMAAMVPPPDFTPEQQRDYYSARKVGIIETHYDINWQHYNPQQWKCNFCGALHDSPADCAEPQLGGVWIYVTPEEYEAEAIKSGVPQVSHTLKIQ